MKYQIKPPISEKQIDLEKIKIAQLELLDYFADICRKNGLSFYLYGGTLLGAVRHQGFIPWDDDIDVSMPRKDYEKFLSLFEFNDFCFLQTIKTDPNYNMHYAKLLKKGTVFKEYITQHVNKENGIFLDIFPIDAIPESRFMQKVFLLRIKLLDCKGRPKYLKVPGSKDKNISFGLIVSKILLFWCTRKKALEWRDRLMKKYIECNSKQVIVGLYFDKIIERQLTNGYSEVVFEGRKMPAPEKFREMLKFYYGDYLKLPPIEERTPHHYIVDIKY